MIFGHLAILTKSGEEGVVYPITSDVTIGRNGNCGIRVDLPKVADQQCRVEPISDTNQVRLHNLNFTNPTLLNGQEFVNGVILEPNDRFSFSGRDFIFQDTDYNENMKRRSQSHDGRVAISSAIDTILSNQFCVATNRRSRSVSPTSSGSGGSSRDTVSVSNADGQAESARSYDIPVDLMMADQNSNGIRLLLPLPVDLSRCFRPTPPPEEPLVLFHKEHCFYCVTPTLCAAQKPSHFCPVIHCDNSCGAVFHACKAEEHLLLCPRGLVPCINATYGCHIKLLRCETAKHLQVCPASVVICGAEWNRKLIDISIEPLLRKLPPCDVSEVPEAEPDIALAKRDQGTIRNALEWPKAQRQLLHTAINSHFPVLPFTPAASDLDKISIEEGYASAGSEDQTDFVAPPFYAKRNLFVQFGADFLNGEYRKPRGVYTFCCEQAFRRDQIAAHAQFLHGFILPELSNGIIHRCPMHLQGCDEFQTRFVAPGGFRVAFNAFLDGLVLRQPTDSSCDHLHDNQASDGNNGVSLLLHVPDVILRRILSLLDSASLYCLSTTCVSLRSACFSLLPVRGFTDFEWRRVVEPAPAGGWPESNQHSLIQRDEWFVGVLPTRVWPTIISISMPRESDPGASRVRWVRGPQRWRFTKSIQPVKECRLELSTMGEHIQHCPFYNPRRHIEKEVIACANSCGAVFHACNAEEHMLLCPREQVPCINATYGCRIKLLRCETAKHLQICPASVVICGEQWHRKLIDISIEPLLRKLPPCDVSEVPEAEPDIALAMRDQGAICDAFEWPKAKRQLLQTPVNSHFPVLPFTPASSDLVASGFGDTSGTGEGYVSADGEDEQTEFVAPPFYAKRNLLVQFGAEFLNADYRKPPGVFTFCCEQALRRDQIAAHAQFLHGFVLPELSNGIIHRCPMHLQGCDEFQTRFAATGGFRLAFNTFLDGLVLRQPTDLSRDHLHNNQATDGNNGVSLLLNVSKVLLHRILSLLDSASLYCVSATCVYLRAACFSLLPVLGVTDFEWRRVIVPAPAEGWPKSDQASLIRAPPSGRVTRLVVGSQVPYFNFTTARKSDPGQNRVRWVRGPQRWRFTKMIEPVKECRLELSTMGEHIQHCPFYNPRRHTEKEVQVCFCTVEHIRFALGID